MNSLQHLFITICITTTISSLCMMEECEISTHSSNAGDYRKLDSYQNLADASSLKKIEIPKLDLKSLADDNQSVISTLSFSDRLSIICCCCRKK